MGVSLVVTQRLEVVGAALEERGISLARGMVEESFGRSIQITDPDDLTIQINEHDPGLHPPG